MDQFERLAFGGSDYIQANDVPTRLDRIDSSNLHFLMRNRSGIRVTQRPLVFGWPAAILVGVILACLGCHQEGNPYDVPPKPVEITSIVDENGNDLGRFLTIGEYAKINYRWTSDQFEPTTPLWYLMNKDHTYTYGVPEGVKIAVNISDSHKEGYLVWNGRISPYSQYKSHNPDPGAYDIQIILGDLGSDYFYVKLSPSSWDVDNDGISDATEQENNSSTTPGGQNPIIDLNGTAQYGWYNYTSWNFPPLIPETTPGGNIEYVNRTSHDYSIAQGTAAQGTLYNGVRLPYNGTGYWHYTGCDIQGTDNWATLPLINLIEAVGRVWHARYQNGLDPYPNITATDLSHANGGPWLGTSPSCRGHHQHQNGTEVDIRLVRTTNNTDPVVYTDQNGNYSRSRTQQLIDIFYELSPLVAVLNNDRNLVNVQPSEGHDDHLHFWIPDPDGIGN